MTDMTLNQLLEEKTFSPTPEQEAILEAGKASNASLMLIAMAGCSKSTTLELLARALPKRSTCYIVFNKKNQIEAEKKFKDLSSPLAKFGYAPHVNILTANSLGHRAWSGAIGKRLILDTKKIGNITKQVLNSERLPNLLPEDFVSIIQLASRARHAGIVPKSFPNARGILPDDYESWELLADSLYLDLNEDLLYVARKVLSESIRLAYLGTIDFDDQIYMSALFGGVFPRYEVCMVDEAQDLSPLNHTQLKRTAGDRLIVVGDPRQAIYAFRGADSRSMDSLRELRNEWVDLPLSTTFRCPRKIVERQQAHAAGFKAHETNSEGVIHDLRGKEWKVEDFLGGTAHLSILCRNNAPLFACALRIIKSGRGCTVLGSEIGKGLTALLKKIVSNDWTDAADAIKLVRMFTEREISKALANGKEERVAVLNDRADCLAIVLENCKTSGEASEVIAKMFSKDNLRITLSTGHKAKGLEWPTVIHLDSWRIPSKFAKKAEQNGNTIPMEQDLNLRYVIETRAQERLVLADLETMK